jgi:7-cyano-7-deazaguanine synthase
MDPLDVVILSGGLDSTTLAFKVANTQPDSALLFVSFNYGQRHKKELDYAAMTADRLQAYHEVVDLAHLTELIATSSLTDPDQPVPDGHYAEDVMKQTVVPNRNMMMISIAGAIAVARKAQHLWIGVHAGDHFIYPDCRPPFIQSMQMALRNGNEGFADTDLIAPFINHSKAQIVEEGNSYGVPFEDTWSCYKGGERHCGSCGTCVERKEAFRVAKVNDPTEYDDEDFAIKAYRR